MKYRAQFLHQCAWTTHHTSTPRSGVFEYPSKCCRYKGDSDVDLAAAARFIEEGVYVCITGRRQAELVISAALRAMNVHAIPQHGTSLEHLERIAATSLSEKGRRAYHLVERGLDWTGNDRNRDI